MICVCYMFCFVSYSLLFSVLFFFFFFKQKTAYEMRISDWSSDVCSSDLLAKLPSGIAAVVFPADLMHVEKYRRSRTDEEFIELARHVAEIDIEIGRASCRERVCQYV